jgi:hypothetical protein
MRQQPARDHPSAERSGTARTPVGYPETMTIAPDYHELHRAVDRLSPVQADALYIVVESMLGESLPSAQTGAPAADAPRTKHRLSFTAAGSGPSDLAERAEDYLHAGTFGHSAE